jgi:hypothetical protein
MKPGMKPGMKQRSSPQAGPTGKRPRIWWGESRSTGGGRPERLFQCPSRRRLRNAFQGRLAKKRESTAESRFRQAGLSW